MGDHVIFKAGQVVEHLSGMTLLILKREHGTKYRCLVLAQGENEYPAGDEDFWNVWDENCYKTLI